jgi:hypothetical protein
MSASANPGSPGDAPLRWPEDTAPPPRAPHKDHTTLAWVLLVLTVPATFGAFVIGRMFVVAMGDSQAPTWAGAVALLPLVVVSIGMPATSAVLGYREWQFSHDKSPLVACVLGGLWAAFSVASVIQGAPWVLALVVVVGSGVVVLRARRKRPTDARPG